MNNKIFLPGTDKQLKLFLNHYDVSGKSVLVMGSGCEEIAASIKENGAGSVMLIVEDNDSLFTSRLILSADKNINVRMMEFDNTDFIEPKFDLVYAQASISNSRRNKIVKEIKRILKPDGFLCAGENVSLKKDTPTFVKDIWSNSDIVPLFVEDAGKYYSDRNFIVVNEFDLNPTLKEFYQAGRQLLQENENTLSEKEKSYYKKILKKISHESNAYLKLGGDAYMGFRMLLLKKGIE
jgi:SAM-dependent methyltransferase